MPVPENIIEPQTKPEEPAEAAAETATDSSATKEDSMEIHPVHGPVLTLREFFVHLAIITLGILIALSLEGLLEWQHHRSLVREARENMAAEISHNKKTVDADLQSLHKFETQLQRIISMAEKMEADPTYKVDKFAYGAGFGSLYSTSWNTANRSGAIGYMSYDEVEKYSKTYDQQQEVLGLEAQLLPPLAQLGGLLQTVLPKDRKHVSDHDLEQLEQLAGQSLVLVQSLKKAAEELSDDYDKIR